jgi:hypothetical protein
MSIHARVGLILALLLCSCATIDPLDPSPSQAAWSETEIQNNILAESPFLGFDELLPASLWPLSPSDSGELRDIRSDEERAFSINPDSLVRESEFSESDSALYAIELDTRGMIQHLTMGLRVLTPVATSPNAGGPGQLEFSTSATIGELDFTYKSRLFLAEVRLWDDSGVLLGTTEVQVPHLISAGLLDFSLSIEDPVLFDTMVTGGLLPTAVARKMGRSFVSLVSLFTLIQENDLLADLLWDAVQKPSLFSIVKNLGVGLSLVPKFKEQVQLPAPGARTPWQGLSDEPHYALPIEVRANGTLAANIDLYITTPRPPLAICGGILALVTHHPTQDITLRMNLLGAHMAASSEKTLPE